MDQAATGTKELGNRLGREASPYLLQHKDNPVHWWPWCDEAFARAEAEDKPILLSVGYAACHWCHVMAHESFEDAGVAAVMNGHFINIKVDREEHPDVDAIYQSALALLGQQGGWPLTMFLTPAREPFWGGTYFPKAASYGRPGFTDVLERLSAVYHKQPQQVEQSSAALMAALRQSAETVPSPENDISDKIAAESLDPDKIVAESGRILAMFDPEHGGLSGAPKFPQAPILDLLAECWFRGGDVRFRDTLVHTLGRISEGGIYDHLGGGFARYSVDAYWLVPHFEKMLYDNALLIELLCLAWQITQNPVFEARVAETIDWLAREMPVRADDPADDERPAAFAAALDADSEGEEGRFYVWRQAEIDEVLGDKAALFSTVYGVTPEGNWEGTNILHRLHRKDPDSDGDAATLAACRAELLARRTERVRPGRDDKVLADWNGLAIRALAKAASVFDRDDWLGLAENAFRFVVSQMSLEEGPEESTEEGTRLVHSWCDGHPGRGGLLDDYAAMILAALSLLQLSGKASYLEQAERWAKHMITAFGADAMGGYYQSAEGAGDLIVRMRRAHDGPTPSGNALAADALGGLYVATGREAYRETRDRLFAAFADDVRRNPFAHAGLMASCLGAAAGLEIVVLGERGDAAVDEALQAIAAAPLPRHHLTVVSETSLAPEHPAAGKSGAPGTVFVCRNQTCLAPIAPGVDLRQAFTKLFNPT